MDKSGDDVHNFPDARFRRGFHKKSLIFRLNFPMLVRDPVIKIPTLHRLIHNFAFLYPAYTQNPDLYEKG